jgi:membrane protease YdiL (CAAX protease family)
LDHAAEIDKLSSMQDQLASADNPEFSQLNNSVVGISPNNPPWGLGIALVVWITSVLLVVFVPTLFLLPYLFSKMGGTFDQTQLAELATKDPVAVWIQVAAILPVHLLTLLVTWYVVTNFRKFPFKQTLGWQSGGMVWWHYVVILVGFLALMIAVGMLVPEQENDLLRILKSSKWALYTIAVLAVFTAPLVEEVVYRGILYSAFQRSVGTFAAVGLVTFLFALVHVPQYWPSFSTIFLLTLLSLILTLIRVYTGNLLPCIILHTMFNGFQSALLIAEPHLDVPVPPVVEPVLIILAALTK